MTIKEYMQSLPDLQNRDGVSVRDVAADATCIWSNTACIGYALDAMERAGIDSNTQDDIIHALWVSFDRLTIAEAEDKGR